MANTQLTYDITCYCTVCGEKTQLNTVCKYCNSSSLYTVEHQCKGCNNITHDIEKTSHDCVYSFCEGCGKKTTENHFCMCAKKWDISKLKEALTGYQKFNTEN
jgi:hypothetical protein